MSIFSSPFPSNGSNKEGIVTLVDPLRFVCSVRLVGGQTLSDVTWLLPAGGNDKAGIHLCPKLGDKVLVCLTTSDPIILGSIPRFGLPDTQPINMTGSTLGVDAGNGTNLKNGYVVNPGKPSDFSIGDKALISEGGGIIAALSSGGILLKASNLAQIFMSKFNGLVRIVGRNYARFSDSSSSLATNVKGKLYDWKGYDWDITRTTSNTERYNEAYSNVATAEVLRGEPNPVVSTPAQDSRIRQYWLNDTSGNRVMVETLYDDGKLTFVVTNGGLSTVTQDNALWSSSVTNGTTSTVTILPGSINLNYNSEATVNIDTNGVQVNAKSHFLIIDSSGVHLG